MQASERQMRGNALIDWLMITLFGLLLLVPGFAQVFGIGGASGENRSLAPFPTITRMKDIKNLPRMADAYVNDRFGLRSQLVHVNSLLRYRIGVSSSKDVVIGKHGWLFYTAHRILEQHTAIDVFKPKELEQWVRQMEANRDWLAQRGIAFYILAAPEKSTVYPEMLPYYPRRPGAKTRLEQLAKRLRTSTLDFIDPTSRLIEAKQSGAKVYYEGDTHWTQRGAFIAYSMLMERVRSRFPSVSPLTLADFDISTGESTVADLARLLTLEGDIKYEVEHFKLRHRSRVIGAPAETYRPRWPWRISERRTTLAEAPRLLVFGDSFTDYVLGPGFLYETFRDPVYTNHHLGNFNFKLVQEIKPQIVVYQFAERYLYAPVGTPIGAE
jgi:alginate O-acetyltransferase complex protein AlgJ